MREQADVVDLQVTYMDLVHTWTAKLGVKKATGEGPLTPDAHLARALGWLSAPQR